MSAYSRVRADHDSVKKLTELLKKNYPDVPIHDDAKTQFNLDIVFLERLTKDCLTFVRSFGH
jgi:hypothetical protein